MTLKMSGIITRVVVLPVYKRTWLLHSWTDAPSPSSSHSTSVLPMTISERFTLASSQLKQIFDSSMRKQWRELQAAKEGSFRSYLYRLAQIVLSREDHLESFLKSIPRETSRVEVMYPVSLFFNA